MYVHMYICIYKYIYITPPRCADDLRRDSSHRPDARVHAAGPPALRTSLPRGPLPGAYVIDTRIYIGI